MSFDEGMQAFKAGDFNRAAEHFVAATEKDENNHKAWNALGICLSKTGEFEQAGLCFENASVLDPSNAIYKKNKAKNDTRIKTAPEGTLELDDEPSIQPRQKSLFEDKPYIRYPLAIFFLLLFISSSISLAGTLVGAFSDKSHGEITIIDYQYDNFVKGKAQSFVADLKNTGNAPVSGALVYSVYDEAGAVIRQNKGEFKDKEPGDLFRVELDMSRFREDDSYYWTLNIEPKTIATLGKGPRIIPKD